MSSVNNMNDNEFINMMNKVISINVHGSEMFNMRRKVIFDKDTYIIPPIVGKLSYKLGKSNAIDDCILKTGIKGLSLFSFKEIDYVNYFIVRDDKTGKYISIDTGYYDSGKKNIFNKFGIDKDMIKMVFITHTDIDHIGGINFFNKSEIYLSELEEPLMNKEEHRMKVMLGLKKVYNHKINSYNRIDYSKKYRIGDLIIEPLLTPGHTPGHTSFVVGIKGNDSKKLIFTGDSLFIDDDSSVNKETMKGIHMDVKKNTDTLNIFKNYIEKKKDAEYMIITNHRGYTYSDILKW